MVSVWPEPPNARSAAPPAGVQLALLADWPYDDLRRPEVVSAINKPRQMVSLPGLGFVCESKLHRIRIVLAVTTWRAAYRSRCSPAPTVDQIGLLFSAEANLFPLPRTFPTRCLG